MNKTHCPALLVLFLLASILSTTCNNGAAAVILAPVAFQVAGAFHLDPATGFLAVAFGASCVFMLPFGNQCNLIVMGPGGYSPKDFLRAWITKPSATYSPRQSMTLMQSP